MATSKKFEEDTPGYYINIIGRHVHVTDAMKNYAMEKLSKLERFHNHIIEVHVTLDIQKLEHSALIIMKFNHFKVTAHAVTSDMYVSIDQAVDKIQKQFRRWKNKIQDHTQKKVSVGEMQVHILERPDEIAEYNEEIEFEVAQSRAKEMKPGKVIGNKTLPLKTLTSEEAVMKMELSGDGFMVYRGEEDQKLKVIYRRKDGNYGIIKTE